MGTTTLIHERKRLEPTEPEQAILGTLGSLAGKRVLDLGCGDGRLAVIAAERGAQVTAIDILEQAVRDTEALARERGMGYRVSAHQMNAHDLSKLGQEFDLAIGKFVLHEIEPLSDFAETLNGVIVPGGKGVFYENNSRNPLLRFARDHMTGRFGIPKYGHDAEYPLEPHELDILEEEFEWMDVDYPQFVFFRLVSLYILRYNSRLKLLMDALRAIDRGVEKLPLPVQQYGYHQLVEFGTTEN